MKREKTDFIIKRYQLEHLVPLALLAISIYFWINNFSQTWIYFTGLIINLLGLIIWWSAKLTLAENWDPGYGVPKIRKLVTSGVYLKISHPLYLGINLTLIGLSLIHLNLILTIFSLAIVLYFFWRMKIETNYLTKTLGKKYLDYRNKTWI